MVTVGYFGRLRDRLGVEEAVAVGEKETIAGLRQRLASLHSDLAGELLEPGVRACVGDELVGEDHVIAANGRVEFLPPVSGG